MFGSSPSWHHEFFFPSSASFSSMLQTQFMMCLERYQLPIARSIMYAAVGTKDCGMILKIYGSRMISTGTGGTFCIRVWFIV